MSPISARSRRPAWRGHVDAVEQRRASSGASTGVLPRFTTCVGPRTASAGLTGTTWPITSQSNSMPDGREVLLDGRGGVARVADSSIQAATWMRLHGGNRRHAAGLAPGAELAPTARP